MTEIIRRETHPGLRLCGLGGHFTPDTRHEIPALWNRFFPWLGQIPGSDPAASYGVSHDGSPDGFGYFVGVHLPSGDPPAGLTLLDVPAQDTLVFHHTGPLSGFPATMDAAFSAVTAHPDLRPAPGYEIETYSDNYNYQTGEGFVEIHISVAPR